MVITSLDNRLVKVTLAGRLDTPAVSRVESRFVAALLQGGNSAIVDLSRVDFVASIGIRMLVSAARSLRLKEAKLAVYGVQERVNQMFETVSLSQIVPVCATEADALAAVGAPARNP